MTEDATGERSVEERLRAVEMVLRVITDKARNIDDLAGATDALASSTVALDETLRTVGEAVITSREAKAQAQTASDRADESLAELALSEHRYRRHTRRIAALATTIALLAAGFVGWQAHEGAAEFHHFQDLAYARCEQRLIYDQANHLSVGADVTELKYQLQNALSNKPAVRTLLRTFPKSQRAALRMSQVASLQALRADLATKQKAYAAGVPGSCQLLK